MKTVAVLGGGPAGSFAAAHLARAGLRAIVLDEKLAWEKPCGGGLTYKAYNQYPFLLENSTPKKLVHETVLAAPGAGQVRLRLDEPLAIYARMDLNQMLLRRAIDAGAEVEKTRVTGATRQGGKWRIGTRGAGIDADYCIVATGARNALRHVGTELSSNDTMIALGYYVPGDRVGIDIQFLEGLEGYIWIFPRCGHMSVGICGKGEAASRLRARLERYMREKGLALQGATFYSHVLPCLDTPAWPRNRVAGDGWMAVGDAAGLVDPITGEGLYYAMRSGDLAAQALVSCGEGAEVAYREKVRQEFARDLEFGSRLARRVFRGKVFFGATPRRMVQFTRRSPRFRAVMQDLFAGTQDYTGLKQRLLDNLNGSLMETAMSFGLRGLLPQNGLDD